MTLKGLSRASYRLKLLRTLEVFTCETVTQEWSLKFEDLNVQGHPDAELVALVEDKNGLRIIMAEKTFGNTLSRRELSGSLCKLLGIPEARASYLTDILAEDDPGTLRKLLELCGAPQLSAENRKLLDESIPGSAATAQIERHESTKTMKQGEKQNPERGEKFDKLPGPGTAFAKSTSSSSKHSDVLIVQGEFDEHEDHVHIIRHTGSSGCKPSAPDPEKRIQQHGGAMVSILFPIAKPQTNQEQSLQECSRRSSTPSRMALPLRSNIQ
jgi:hypothetical protein